MRPIDSGNPITATGAAVAPDLTGASAPVAPSPEQPVDIADPAAAARKRLEQNLDVSYFKGQLGQTQPTRVPGVLYDKPPGGAGAQAAETKQAAPIWAGMNLGTNQFGEAVRVKREIGSSQGYENRMEATAAARLNGAEPAAIVQGNDGKWHAFQTTASFYPAGLGSQTAADTPTRQVHGLASSAAVDDMRRKVLSLKANLAQPHSSEERSQNIQNLKQARIELASLTFGVPESDINMDSTKAEAGKINLVPGDKIGGADGETDPDFRTGNTVTKINVGVLEDSKRAEVVQFHEGMHAQDDRLAHDWYAKYQAANPKADFQAWITNQANLGHISKADAEVVNEIAGGSRKGTEARAHVEAALAAFEAGDAEAGKRELAPYAGMTLTEHHQSGTYSNLAVKSTVKDELTRKLQDAYQHMSPDMQQELQAAIAAAQKENPEAWISQVKLPK